MSVFDRIGKKDIHNTMRVINQLACSLIKGDEPVMYENTLKVIVDAFESELGLLALVSDSENLIVKAMYGSVLEECQMPDKNKIIFPKDSLSGIWGHALSNKEIMFVNEGPFGIPEKHIEIKRVMIAPILSKDKVIGNITLGNRDSDYTNEDADLLKAICIYLSPLLQARIDVDTEKLRTGKFQKAIWDMLNYANMFVLLLDENMNIKLLNWSLATKLGFKNEVEPLGRCWLDFLPDEDKEWIKVIHHHVTYTTAEAEKYKEVINDIVTLSGEVVKVKWFNALINHNYNFTFSMGIYKEPDTKITEESIRTFYRDVIEKDKVMIKALKHLVNVSYSPALESEKTF